MLHCGTCASELKLSVSSCLSLTWESAQINSCGAMESFVYMVCLVGMRHDNNQHLPYYELMK